MSSVQWLLSELKKVNYHPTEAMVMYAKNLHKKEIVDAYEVGNNDYANFSYVATSGEDYYATIFESKNNNEEDTKL